MKNTKEHTLRDPYEGTTWVYYLIITQAVWSGIKVLAFMTGFLVGKIEGI